MNSKILEWKKGYINYLKEVEKIMEFLNIIGVYNVFLWFEDVRIVWDMWNFVNCLVNCEIVNLNKMIGVVIC